MPFEILNVFANIILSPPSPEDSANTLRQQQEQQRFDYNLSPLKSTTIPIQLQKFTRNTSEIVRNQLEI